jgi:pilus assembly protein CpaF
VATARSIVEGEVRELVRRRALDPVADPATVARLIDDAISDYVDRRVTTSALPPLGDRPGVSRAILDAIAGFGPLQPFLDDPAVDDYRASS